MSSLIERRIAGLREHLIVLAPPLASLPEPLVPDVTPNEYSRFIREAQRLRGAIYLRDGAITPHDLTSDGAYVSADDARSWQFLLLDANGGVGACSWYLEHENTVSIDRLRMGACPLVTRPDSRAWARSAIDAELARARAEGIRYAEVGGWAVAEHRRCCTEALSLIIVTFAVSRLLGGALGLATATMRHSSAEILRRVGFNYLGAEADPPSRYFDPRYDCDMELLRFDTRRLSVRYDATVDRLASRFGQMRVIAASSAQAAADNLQLVAA